jgi:Mitochondrial carrier protein
MAEDLIRSVAAAGSSAVITVTGIHPIDVVKTRLQVSGQGTRNYKALGISGTVKTIFKEEGIQAFWKGIGAAWLREASYTSLRLGLYSPIKKVMNVKNDSHFFLKFTAGSAAGGIGSIVGNPFDVVKTKMMAYEGKIAPSFYRTILDIYKYETYTGFYRGLQANIMRACVLNGTKMACYDQIKQTIMKTGIIPSGIATQFCAAFGAGFFMATTVAPFDMIRTKLMSQPSDHKLYNGFIDCLLKLLAEKGPRGLYAGFVPIWARFAPTTCLQLVIFEQVKPFFGVEGSGE